MRATTRRTVLLGVSSIGVGCLPGGVPPTGSPSAGTTGLLRDGSGPATAHFKGGTRGAWKIDRLTAIAGPSLPEVPFLDVVFAPSPDDAAWQLRGVASHVRYTTRAEKGALDAVSPPLGRLEATRAVLIPIRKNAAWWAMTQDERRAIFEERSHHIAATMQYLPRVARTLYQSRDVGEPFDFLTWFEFDPQHETAFDELLARLRASEEWRFVEREVEIRATRVNAGAQVAT